MEQTRNLSNAGTSERVAIYPGTFDPFTNGHASIVRRGKKLFDKVIVAVAEHSTKTPLFSLEERLQLAQDAFDNEDGVIVEAFSGLLMQYVHNSGACAILRGLRAISDFEFEFQTALMNRHLNKEIETTFLMADYRWLYTSSTMVKTVASLGGDVSELVPPNVYKRLCEKFGEAKYKYEDVVASIR